ncbi:MAG: phosphoethanolamine--lipid A transferase [Xanthomonadales bacterium]|nr:phosphoethanolamine--lipid A transferase [Xanthomonadales bacterium]
MRRPELSSEWLILATALYLVLAANTSFLRHLHAALGGVDFALQALVFGSVLAGLIGAMLALVTPSRFARALLGVVVVIAAALAFFMDHYGAVIDRHALQSALETDARESAEWLSFAMLRSVLVLSVPALLALAFVRTRERSWPQALKARGALLGACALLVAVPVALDYRTMASVARNHAELRDLANPINLVNATRSYLKHSRIAPVGTPLVVAADVRRGETWSGAGKRPLVLVFVIGESVRASSLGLLGYARDTTPELARRGVVAFGEVQACGTNTATSVPCMFSGLGQAGYDEATARTRENLLDVLERARFDVLWIDNNTGSKHVADRVVEIDVAAATRPRICNTQGCFDHVLVSELEERLATIERDTVLLLHQKGSHGPAYFERYPEAFRRFVPDCRSNELQSCTREQLVNSYDNTILYTDRELAEMVDALAAARERVDGVLLYVSDHGESTGEHGYYLHGAPALIAPEEQTRVPMLLWMAPEYLVRRQLDATCVAAQRGRQTSHDAVFPLVLGLLDLHTTAYDPKLDPIAACAPRP